ncbi:MAG: archaeosortase H, partial [Promethearchaeota archaeon]
MTEIEFEGKIYKFSWWDILFFIILCPLIALAIFKITDFFWLYTHPPVLQQTCWLINLITNMGIDYGLGSNSYYYIIPGKGNIGFETMCTGVQATAIFAGLIIMTPHSKDEEANKRIWRRKLLSLAVAAFLFHIVNLLRMVLQLTLYYNGFAWDDIHTPIGAA